MKIMFLHLCDLHISSSQVNPKIDKIVGAVRSLGTVDQCILICSGDLAFSGIVNEYKCVRDFFSNLLSKLAQNFGKSIDFFLVPGNHDMVLNSESRNSADILEYYNTKCVDEKYKLELPLLNEFYEYAKSKDCFVENLVLDTRVVDYNGFKVQYNLLNTAPFSTLKADNKEIHYLPDAYLYLLVKRDEVDLSITVMHHSTEWFHWETKNSVENVLRRHADIVFQGHDHNIRTVQTEGFILSKGGEFSGLMTHSSTFSVLIFDTDTNKLCETEFVWDIEQTMFHKNGDSHHFDLIPKTNILLPRKEFINKFYEDPQKLTTNILDYFVFPKLYHSKKNANDSIIIIRESIFWNKLFEHKIINVTGKSRSGKTTLLKYLYSRCIAMKKVPLYLGSDTYDPRFTIDKLLRNLVDEQYGEDQFTYERYEQIDVNQKVILIDDLDMISYDRQKLISIIRDKIAFIVFTSQNHFEIDIKNATKDELLKSEVYFNINIEDFYKEKRAELVSKICGLKRQEESDLLNYIIQIIDHLVERHNGLFELSPEYIVQYVKYFLNREIDDRRGEAIFNVVFETNLRNAIMEYSTGRYLEYCLFTLEEIAFYMHSKKSERFSFTEIVNLVNEINENGGLSIDIEKCLNNVMSAKVIKKSSISNLYEFTSPNYMAYFIAKKLNKLIEKNGFDITELQYIFRNICFGINDNILLFLSFLRENTAFALNICELLNSIVSEYPELNFDQNNISFIKRQREINVSLPSQKEKKEYEEASDNIEKQRRENELEEIRYKGIYDYNEAEANTFGNRIVCALKYLEIISKSLISHFVNLNLTEKQKLIDLMYTAPNRILYALLKYSNDHYDEVINDLTEFITSFEEFSEYKREDVEKAFIQTAVSICLGVYDRIAFFGANIDTLRLLNKYEMNNSNYRIENLVMEENGGTTADFVEKAIRLRDSEDDTFITNLVRLIARKHLITRNVDFRTRDKIGDRLFSTTSKKQLYLTTISKRKREKK